MPSGPFESSSSSGSSSASSLEVTGATLTLDTVADGEYFKRSGLDVVGTSINELSPPFFRTLSSGSVDRWYPASSWSAATLSSGGSAAANKMRAFPIIFASGRTVSDVAFNVLALVAGSEVRLGIYEDNGSCYPGDLYIDFGAVSSATTGVKTITGLSTTLTNEVLLWAVCWQSGNISARSVSSSSFFPILGTSNTLSTDLGVGWESTQTLTPGVSVLPSTFPVGASTLPGSASNYPIFFMKFSS